MRNIFLLMTLLWCQFSFAATQQLSADAVVSLLTCSPGAETYNAYGHSAIRIKDNSDRLDLVYNYGTFDNSSPNFVLNFARGLVQYSLEIEPFSRFYDNYDRDGRSIYEQTLHLTQEQKQEIFDLLNETAKPENKYYWYDFIFNNCSSVIRDLLEDIIGIEFPRHKTKESFRYWIDFYNDKGEWGDLGIDVLLGAKIDRKAREYETMFLPDHLMRVLDETKVNGRALVSPKTTILDHGHQYYSEGGWMGKIRPAPVFWIMLLIFFLYKIYSKDKFPPAFSVLFLTILGLTGWFLLFMWFGTRHDATKWNMNILWAFPFHFPFALMLFKKDLPRWVVKYFHVTRVILIALLFVWPFFPQDFHIAILPIILIALLAISSNIPVYLKPRRSRTKSR